MQGVDAVTKSRKAETQKRKKAVERVKVEVCCPVKRTFRVEQMAGLFDLSVEQRSHRKWNVDLPAIGDEWAIGAIVGPSGSGKSVIGRRHYGRQFIEGYKWPKDKAIVDGFPESMSVRDITGMLNSVGFSSPPDWVKPYAVLSNGQRFRCDLTRALLTPAPVIAFDEFTSVVDRQVARFGAAAVAKTIRKGRTQKFARRFVAVTCHYDVLAWLQPDWVLDLGSGASGRLARRWVRREAGRYGKLVGQRPAVRVDVCRAPRTAWDTFKQHHYLTERLHHTARCYLGWWKDRAVAFGSTICNMGHPGRRIAHRFVVLPDFQGLGIGIRLTEAVARLEVGQGASWSIRTSHPALIRALKNRVGWRCSDVTTSGSPHRGKGYTGGASNSYRGSLGRATATFQWVGREPLA
jgi:GNAT superfamily N-acetyltransferase/ABC-type molybdenum transport system ATPase subunit/photorepair protein PhrA